MSILVVGSVAFDDITSPSGSVENILGGAATYFALAGSYFTKVRVVAVVGDDFGPEHEAVFRKHGIDTRGVEHAQGKTFRWGANVRRAMNGVRLTGCDTMNYWIKGTRQELAETLKLVDLLLINDTEAKMLAKETNLPRAAQKVLAMGPQALVIKHGEYGATIFFREGAFGMGRHPFRAPA